MALTADQRQFLEAKRFAVLGTVNASGSPNLTIMWYLLDGDDIVFNTKVGRAKETNLGRDKRVSLLVYDESNGYKYMRIDGRVRAITDQTVAQADIARLAIRYQGQERATGAIERFKREERVSYRLPTTRIYDYR